MNVITSFEDMLSQFTEQQGSISSEEMRIRRRVFLFGMQAGIAVLQNRMAVTSFEVSQRSEEEQQKILGHLAQTCMNSLTDLEKLTLTEMGMGYGTA